MLQIILFQFILTLLLLIAQNVYANISKTPCPSFNTIRQLAYKINKAYQFDEGYFVGTKEPVLYENNQHWAIIVFLSAKSSKQAIRKAKKAVENINYCKQKFARDQGNGQLMCVYEPQNMGIVTAFVDNKR